MARAPLPDVATRDRAGTSAGSRPPADPPALVRARALARLLDAAVGVPGTRLRIGLDALVGLVPGLGDVAGAASAGYIVLVAARLGAPASVLVRMLLNTGLDALVGTVPLLGDLFDVGWKANLRNVALLERHVADPRGARAASRGVVLAVLGALALLAVGAVAVTVAVVRALLGVAGAAG